MNRSLSPRAACMAALLPGFVFSFAATAATLTPTRFDDPAPNGCLPGDCSLREAVRQANATTGGDTIVLASGTYTLTATGGSGSGSYDLDVSRPLVVDGVAGGTTIRVATGAALPENRVFRVVSTSLQLIDIRLRGGDVATDRGGCVHVANGSLTMDRGDIATCRAASGGAIAAVTGTVTLRGTTVYRNDGAAVALQASTLNLQDASIVENTGERGGGVYIDGETGSFVFATGASEISDNVADMGAGVMIEWGSRGTVQGPAGGWLEIARNQADGGGGILSGFGLITGRNLRIADNVSSGAGGGVHVSGVDFRRVVIERNVAQSGGGGYVVCGSNNDPCVVAETAIADNTATFDGGGLSVGGVALKNVSSTGNRAQRGGGFYVFGDSTWTHVTSHADEAAEGASMHQYGAIPGYPTVRLRNAVLSGGCTRDAGTVPVVISQGANAQGKGTPSCGLVAPNDIGFVSSTQAAMTRVTATGMPVVSIGASSVFVNAGDPAWCEARDVRGYTRPLACDIGAYERGAVAP